MRAPRIILIILASGVFFVGGNFVLQKVLMRRAVNLSLRAVDGLVHRLPDSDESEQEEQPFFPLFPFQALNGKLVPHGLVTEADLEGAVVELEEEPATPSPQPRRVSSQVSRKAPSQVSELGEPPPVGPAPISVRAKKEMVLHWAEHQIVPQGRSLAAGHGLPAGIELLGAAALGVGLLDGDRLIAVDGAPVATRSDVVKAAILARGQGRESISATLVRKTAEGASQFTVILEQPYREDLKALEQRAQAEKDVQLEETEPSTEAQSELLEGQARGAVNEVSED